MISFSATEIKFLESLEECRIATSHDNIPHIKPVSYIFHDCTIWIATDYDTRTYKNIKKNPRIAISVDIYKKGDHKAILVQGQVKIIENGEEFKQSYEQFFKKFEWVRNDPWKENEAPFLKIIPKNKTSWGLQALNN